MESRTHHISPKPSQKTGLFVLLFRVIFMKKIKVLCAKYQQAIYTLFAVALILGIVYFSLHGFDAFIKWVTTDVGSVAEWTGSIGTIAAFGAVIWQQGRQENITRAVNVEESRPRFSISFTPKCEVGTKILFWNRNSNDINALFDNFKGYRFISMQNISDNVVYDFSVILKYHGKDNSNIRTDYWNHSGIFPKQSIIIIPKFKGTEDDEIGNYIYDELLVKFTTPANEVGFYSLNNSNDDRTDSSLGSEKYYFVKGSHIKGVTAINKDEMLTVKSEKCQEFDKQFNSLRGHTNFLEKHHDGKIY